MNKSNYLESINAEMSALRDRVRNFIDDRHWLTDGEWKEAVLRTMLRRLLPEPFKVGRGFVFKRDRVSPQMDIIIYNAQRTVLFSDGDLVFVPAEAVVAMIEVKTSLSGSDYSSCINKMTETIKQMSSNIFSAVFAYDANVNDDLALSQLKSAASGQANHVVDMLCLGGGKIIKWFYNDVDNSNVKSWRLYEVQNCAYAVFIHQIIEFLDESAVLLNQRYWFSKYDFKNYKSKEMGLL